MCVSETLFQRINAVHAGRQCKYGQWLAYDVVYSICQNFGMFRRSRNCPWVKLLLEILRVHRVKPCANHTTGLGSEIHEWMVPRENWIKIILRRSVLEQ